MQKNGNLTKCRLWNLITTSAFSVCVCNFVCFNQLKKKYYKKIITCNQGLFPNLPKFAPWCTLAPTLSPQPRVTTSYTFCVKYKKINMLETERQFLELY